LARYYFWFVIVVAGLAGIARVLLPRRFAELQLERFRAENALRRARRNALLFLVVGLMFGSVYFLPWGHQSWVIVGSIFSLLSAVETYFQARYPTLEALVFQSRLLGILYLGLSAASYVLLKRV
jgi:hypothetical protein